MSREKELLKKLLEAATDLDVAYCTYLNRGENDLTADRYEDIEDIMLEVEDYLKEE